MTIHRWHTCGFCFASSPALRMVSWVLRVSPLFLFKLYFLWQYDKLDARLFFFKLHGVYTELNIHPMSFMGGIFIIMTFGCSVWHIRRISPRKALIWTERMSDIVVHTRYSQYKPFWQLGSAHCSLKTSSLPAYSMYSSLEIIYTTVQKFWVTRTISCFSMKTHTFIYQMNLKYSQDIQKVRNNDFNLKY